jgi:hypothetical protein
LRRHTWPGLALAGGVLIAAVIALLLIGGGKGPDGSGLPNPSSPSETRLFSDEGELTATPPERHRTRRHADHPSPGAAGFQYGVGTSIRTSLGGAG